MTEQVQRTLDEPVESTGVAPEAIELGTTLRDHLTDERWRRIAIEVHESVHGVGHRRPHVRLPERSADSREHDGVSGEPSDRLLDQPRLARPCLA